VMILKKAILNIFARKPDVVIGGEENPYLLRWYIIPRNRFFNIYLHQVRRDDDNRALHDHPWWSISYIVWGAYYDHRIKAGGIHKKTLYEAGSLIFRRAASAHRLSLHGNRSWPVTIFITGPRIREWGFHCPNGWRHWADFTTEDGREIGRGCD